MKSIDELYKVELHLHLDGSVPLEVASELSGLSIEEVKDKMIANDKCENLSEYLTKFDLPISIMQSRENLVKVSRELVKYLETQNIVYAEIRFAPMFHTKEGLSYEEIVEAVLEGLKSDKVKTNLILCMMRGMDRESNIKTIEVVEKYLGKGVCGIDLAGAEDKYPLDEYIELFDIVKEKGIPFTIHAGENGSYEEVKKAIKIGAKRIGHGIHAIDDNGTIELIKENNVLLEVCPTSNVQTNAVDEYVFHPIKELYMRGVRLNINTDNITVSNISLNEEYGNLYDKFWFIEEDFNKMNIMAIENSFMNDEEKIELIDKYFK